MELAVEIHDFVEVRQVAAHGHVFGGQGVVEPVAVEVGDFLVRFVARHVGVWHEVAECFHERDLSLSFLLVMITKERAMEAHSFIGNVQFFMLCGNM